MQATRANTLRHSFFNMKSPFPYLAILLFANLATIHADDAPSPPANTSKPATPEVKIEPFDFDKEDANAHAAYFLKKRKSAAADPYRPLYHFLSLIHI